VAAVVQARMTSSRLPGKVLADIGGRPALSLLLERLRRATQVDEVAVATSTDVSDDPVAETASRAGARVIRGPLDDVLERYRGAAQELDCDAVVRITGDCPFVEPAVVDLVVARWRDGDEDYVANVIEPRTYPKGMDAEVLSRPALGRAAAEAEEPYDREHVTPFVRDRPDRFPQAAVTLDPPRADVTLALDTEEDLAKLRRLHEEVGPEADLQRLLAAYY
jgi:spore coat polysaccharide biosynthesis protein SpsF